MHPFHFYHGHKAHRLSFSDFWMYELSMWLHTLAHALISIFMPILLLKAGFPIGYVVAYYLLYNIIDAPLNILARELVTRFGARFVIALATMAVIVFFSIFLNLKTPSLQILVLLAAFEALYDALYWVGHIFLFISSNDKLEQTGKSTGILYAVRQFALMTGPIIGAALLVFFSQRALLVVTIGVFLLSLVPLAKVDDFSDKPSTPRLPIKKFFELPHGRRAFLSIVLYAMHDSAESVIFPLFIFVTFGTLQSVALIPVVMSLAAIVVVLLLGNVRPDRRRFTIGAGAALVALMWVVRLSFPGAPVYYGSIFAIGIFTYFILVPLDSLVFEYGRTVGDPLSASMYRNIAYMGSNVVFYCILGIFVNMFNAAFALAALALLMLFAFSVGQLLLPARQPRTL